MENLSGYETRCEMIDKASHDFDYAQKEAGARGRNVVGLYGSAPNFDSTPNALREILANMKEVSGIFQGLSVFSFQDWWILLLMC